MQSPKRSPTREARIHDEIIVDAYDGSEQAMGWYYYLDDHLHFPFDARCLSERAISPLKKGETVPVLAMAPEVSLRPATRYGRMTFATRRPAAHHLNSSTER